MENTQQNAEQELLYEAEWCFQFDNDEPQIIAVTPEGHEGQPLSITVAINNTENSNVSFTKDGKIFQLYSRPITDSGREFRTSQQAQVVSTRPKEDEATD